MNSPPDRPGWLLSSGLTLRTYRVIVDHLLKALSKLCETRLERERKERGWHLNRDKDMSYSFWNTFGKWFFGLHFSLQLHAVVLLDTPGVSQWNKHTKAHRKCLPGRVKFIGENKISQKKNGICEGWAGLVFNLEFLWKRHQRWKSLHHFVGRNRLLSAWL